MADLAVQSSSPLTNNPLAKASESQILEYRDEGGNPYKKRFVVRRIQLDDLYLSDNEAFALMQAIGENRNSIVFGGVILIKCSSVTAVEPRWSAENPPERPKVKERPVWSDKLNKPVYEVDPVSAKQAAYWDEVFGGK